MAYNNWKYKLAGQYPGMSEEEFVNMVASLQARHYGGLIDRQQYDAQLTEVLKNPSSAVEILKTLPQQRSTDSLMRELEQLHKGKILNDDEYEERKSELMFQRNANSADVTAPLSALEPEERRRRLMAHLEALRSENIISPTEFDAFKARI